MVSDGCFNFVGGVIFGFETPSFGVVYGALWWDGFVVGSGFGVVRGRVMRSGVGSIGGRGIGIVVNWGRVVDYWGRGIRIMISGCGTVSVSIRCRGRGVPMSMVDDSMTSGMVCVSFGTGIGAGDGNQSGNDLEKKIWYISNFLNPS